MRLTNSQIDKAIADILSAIASRGATPEHFWCLSKRKITRAVALTLIARRNRKEKIYGERDIQRGEG